MRNRRIAFLGSKPIGLWCLQYLYDHQEDLDIEVVAVLSKDNANIAHKSLNDLASEYGTKRLSALEELCEQSIDFIFSVQYHEILKKRHIQTAKTLAVNLHMAPLPEYRGCNQFSFALIDKKEKFGTTLHQMLPGVDNGPILFERRFPISEAYTVDKLYEETVRESQRLWSERIADVINGQYTPIDQTELIPERGTSTHYRNEMGEIKRIDPAWPQEKILRYLRATYMPGFPPPYMEIEGTKIELVPHW